MKAVFDYLDTFTTRIREMEQQKRDGVVCKKEDKPRSLENFLSRYKTEVFVQVETFLERGKTHLTTQIYGLITSFYFSDSSHVCYISLIHCDDAC